LASSGLAWRGEDSEFKVAAESIKWAQWLRVARNWQLRIGMKDRKRETLDGFMREVVLVPYFLTVLTSNDERPPGS
jgi:structure-specific recognition protein 1